MNERIQELANKVGLSLVDSPVWKNHFERFIDLLMAECQSATDDLRGYSGAGDDGYPYDTASWNAALEAVATLIQHRLRN